MIEILETVRNYEKSLFGLCIDKSSWTGYRRIRWVCDLCGKEVIKNVQEWDYGGWSGVSWNDYPPQIVLEYGKYNKRKIAVCPTHTDTEIENKLEELKD